MRPKLKLGGSYAALTKFKYPFILCEGPRGTAKSRSILSILLARLLAFPGSRLLLCRRFRSDLTKTILATLEEEVFPSFNIPIPGGAHRAGRDEYRLDNGSIIWPVGIDSGMGVLSMGVTFAYVAEVIEMEEQMVTDIAGGMRWMRSAEHPELPDYTQIIADTNPGPPSHWVNMRAEDVSDDIRRVETRADYARLQKHNFTPAADPAGRWKRIVTKHQDNPGYWDHNKWDWTELGQKYVKETLEVLKGFRRLQWLLGLWRAPSGTVFPEFERDTHVLKENFEPPAWWPQILCYDPGFGTTACLWIAISPTGDLYVFDEIYEGGKSMHSHCAEIIRRNEAGDGRNVMRYFGDPNEMFSDRAQGPSCARQARDAGLRFIPWPADKAAAFDAGVEAVRHLLGPPARVFICPRCTGLVSNFESWMFKKNASGVVGADRYEQANDHAIDCLRGGVQSGFLQKEHQRMQREIEAA